MTHCHVNNGLSMLASEFLTAEQSPSLKLTDPDLVKKFRAVYGTRKFIVAFSTGRHLSLSWTRSTQSMPPHATAWRFILILSSQLSIGLLSGLFLSIRSFHQNNVCTSTSPHTYHTRCPSLSSRFECLFNIWWMQSMKPLVCVFLSNLLSPRPS